MTPTGYLQCPGEHPFLVQFWRYIRRFSRPKAPCNITVSCNSVTGGTAYTNRKQRSIRREAAHSPRIARQCQESSSPAPPRYRETAKRRTMECARRGIYGLASNSQDLSSICIPSSQYRAASARMNLFCVSGDVSLKRHLHTASNATASRRPGSALPSALMMVTVNSRSKIIRNASD